MMRYFKIIAAVALATTALVAPAGATENDPEPCVPTEGHYTDWVKTGWTPWQHGDDTRPGEDTDTVKFVGPITREHVTKEAWTEEVLVTEAVPEVWANFSPNREHRPFTGPPTYPDDERGTWHVHDKIPGGHVGEDGVYQQGNGNGSWFYRQAGQPAVYDYVDHPAESHTDYKWKVYEREWVEGNECPPPEECPDGDFNGDQDGCGEPPVECPDGDHNGTEDGCGEPPECPEGSTDPGCEEPPVECPDDSSTTECPPEQPEQPDPLIQSQSQTHLRCGDEVQVTITTHTITEYVWDEDAQEYVLGQTRPLGRPHVMEEPVEPGVCDEQPPIRVNRTNPETPEKAKPEPVAVPTVVDAGV